MWQAQRDDHATLPNYPRCDDNSVRREQGVVICLREKNIKK